MGRVKDILGTSKEQPTLAQAIVDAANLSKGETEVLSTMIFKFAQDKDFIAFAKKKGVNIDELAKKLK